MDRLLFGDNQFFGVNHRSEEKARIQAMRMPAGLAAYRRALVGRRCRAIAMSGFASGAIAPRDAIEWVCAQPNMAPIVLGASSRANIRQTRALVQHGWPEPVAAGCLEAVL